MQTRCITSQSRSKCVVPIHQGCTAMIRAIDPISEFEIGRQNGVNFA